MAVMLLTSGLGVLAGVAPVAQAASEEGSDVVVAVVDTGISAGHEIFERPGATDHPSTYLEGYPGDAQAVDASTFDNEGVGLTEETLYWFPETNVVGAISFGEWASDQTITGEPTPTYPISDERGHGTSTAGTLTHTNEEAKIVAIEVGGISDIQAGIHWAAEQPWIDAVSVSIGTLANVPLPNDVYNATHHASEEGKPVVVSAGNTPTASAVSPYAGPPWVITVGGAEDRTKGTDVLPAKSFDYTSNFTVHAPTAGTEDGYHWTDGTSFAAPTVAGTISSVVLELRQQFEQTTGIDDGALVHAGPMEVTQGDIRDVLNHTAEVWGPAQYEPGNFQPDPTDAPADRDRTSVAAYSTNVPTLAAASTTGWGYVGPRVVDDTVEHLLPEQSPHEHDDETEKALLAPQMETIYEVRQQYWELRPVQRLADNAPVPCYNIPQVKGLCSPLPPLPALLFAG